MKCFLRRLHTHLLYSLGAGRIERVAYIDGMNTARNMVEEQRVKWVEAMSSPIIGEIATEVEGALRRQVDSLDGAMEAIIKEWEGK